MTDDRDPALQALFVNAEQDLAGEVFTARVMSRTDALKRRTVFAWICAGLVASVLAWLVATPLQYAVNLLTQGVTAPLITLDDRWLAQLFAPVNSVAILLAVGLIGLRTAYKKIFSVRY